ncbi:MAG: UDP-N-acetylmuramoyl-tripeptide--D-alanyl-D-alanine ligase [Ignavibacteria bacterium]|nr:MAG: UDP-N-acetylmuramoyl-tripeptide--D-alanyl-D-alanine ligase [Ignavibacteria bacterium]
MRGTVADLLTIPHVRAVNCDAIRGRVLRRIVTDSRDLRKGDVFVAFRGARVDAHDLVPDVCARGARVCVVENRWYRKHASAYPDLPLLVVKDTVEAYGAIAQFHRRQFDIPLLAITGSNGKTSTKEMIGAVLKTKYNVLLNAGNYNNQIGLPATLLRVTDRHDLIVTEMGTNQPGDIPYLCDIAGPTHGLITNIGRAHMEKLLSREGIAAEKGALYASLPKGGVALINADEPLLRARVPRGRTRVSYGTTARSDVRIVDVRLDRKGKAIVKLTADRFVRRPITLRLQSLGRHAAYNAAAALAVGFVFGCGVTKMKAALERIRNADKRMQLQDAAGITVINDTYNANPDSVLAAVDLLQQITVQGKRCVVLGDMLELGRISRQEHEAIGAALAAAGIPYVLTFGSRSRAISSAARSVAVVARHFREKQQLLDTLDALLDDGDAVLVKGSRSMHMEDVVGHLLRRNTSEEESR